MRFESTHATTTRDGVLCFADLDGLTLIYRALNEVCNGMQIGDFEFSTRLGPEREVARGLLDQVEVALDSIGEHPTGENDPSTSPHRCGGMDTALLDERVPLVYGRRFREYGLDLRASAAAQAVTHCPWCGAKLPADLRDRYFDELEAMGINTDDVLFDSSGVPSEFQTDEWWISRGL